MMTNEAVQLNLTVGIQIAINAFIACTTYFLDSSPVAAAMPFGV